MYDVIMMSLGLCMAGTDNHRNSGSRRVNMKIWGGVPIAIALTETYSDTNFDVYWHYGY